MAVAAHPDAVIIGAGQGGTPRDASSPTGCSPGPRAIPPPRSIDSSTRAGHRLSIW